MQYIERVADKLGELKMRTSARETMDVDTIALAAQQRDLAAFNELVLAFQETAYNVAYRITGNSDAAADATQDAFIKAYRNLGQYRGGSFKAWLLRIVTNTCYDLLRARKRRPVDSLVADDRDPDYDRRWTACSESPEDYAAHRETVDWIQAAILRLPAEFRLVLVLRDVEGMSYEEVGQIAGIPPGTVKSRLNRARARLRYILAASGEVRLAPLHEGAVLDGPSAELLPRDARTGARLPRPHGVQGS